MDFAYDHLQEDTNKKDEGSSNTPMNDPAQPSLNSEIQDAYRAISASPWGARIGGFFGSVVKQGESVYTQASKELAEVKEDATKGLSGLQKSFIEQTRNVSLKDVVGASAVDEANKDDTETKDKEQTTEESESVLALLRAEAAKRLKDLQRAEDAADEALLRFGGNVRDFLRDAISVAPPSDQDSTVLFESKDSKGKRVIHTSRFDAQLHVIHTSTEGFTKDPSLAEYAEWTKDFDIEQKTADISDDLTKYPELRTTMEKLVPDQIPYADFWRRYYYLRHGIETAEARRKDLLKGKSTEDLYITLSYVNPAAAAEDEVAWDDDSEEENEDEDEDETPPRSERPASIASAMTINPPAQNSLKSAEPRKSNDEKSQADSEASYDVVGQASGMTSQAPNSPKDTKKDDDSDDEDWE